jgi:hypothetical protein
VEEDEGVEVEAEGTGTGEVMRREAGEDGLVVLLVLIDKRETWGEASACRPRPCLRSSELLLQKMRCVSSQFDVRIHKAQMVRTLKETMILDRNAL